MLGVARYSLANTETPKPGKRSAEHRILVGRLVASEPTLVIDHFVGEQSSASGIAAISICHHCYCESKHCPIWEPEPLVCRSEALRSVPETPGDRSSPKRQHDSLTRAGGDRAEEDGDGG